MDLGIVLTIIVAAQLYFLSIFLFTNRQGRRLSNRLLGLFFLLLALNLTDLLLKIKGYDTYYHAIALIDDSFILAYGPLIFLYVCTVIHNLKEWKTSWWRHFIPFLLLAVFLMLVQNLQAPPQQLQLMDDIERANLPGHIQLFVVLAQLHPLIYLVMSFRELRNYRLQIRERFSNIDAMDLRWLSFTLRSVLVLMIVSLLHATAPVLFNPVYIRITVLLLVISLLYFVNRWLWKALRESNVISGLPQGFGEKYKGSNLTDDERFEIKQQLEALIKVEKPYLNADLSLDQLALRLSTTPKTLSQVINQSYGRNFYEWINYHRITEAKQRLISNPGLTVLEVLYQCGYNSKSSFNTFFKKHTGTTPTRFRAQQKKP